MRIELPFVSVRSISMMAAVTAVCLLFVSDVNAQRGGGGFGRVGAQLMSNLLSMEEVQKELELTDEQIEEVVAAADQLNEDLRAEAREIMQGGGDPSEVADLVKEMREQEAEILAKLDDDQKNRLKQLNYQRMGPALLADEEAQKELEFTEEQKDKVTEASTAMREKAMELFQGGDREGMREKMAELQEEMQKTLASLLTEEQNEKLVEMKGEVFEFPERQRGEGRRSDF